jgi:hypothetical protein
LSCIFTEYSLTINDTDYIQCTSRCSQIIVSFSQPFVLPPECQENNNITNIYDYALVCHIEYRIDYDNQQITIDFQASNDAGSLENKKASEYLVQTISLGLSKIRPERTVLTREYYCNTNNDCARKFYFNSIQFFITEGQEQLDSLKSKLHNDSLIVGEESKRRCIDSDNKGPKQSVICKTGLCYADFENYGFNEKQNRTQKCQSEKHAFLSSEIKQHTPKSAQDREFLKYRCNKNVCNRDDFMKRIRSLIGDYTTATSKIQGDTPVSEKKGNLSIHQTISSYSLVLFFFLIQLFI